MVQALTQNMQTTGRLPVGYVDQSGMPMRIPVGETSNEFRASVRWVYSETEFQEAMDAFEARQQSARAGRVAASMEEAQMVAAEQKTARDKNPITGHVVKAQVMQTPIPVSAFAGVDGIPVSSLKQF